MRHFLNTRNNNGIYRKAIWLKKKSLFFLPPFFVFFALPPILFSSLNNMTYKIYRFVIYEHNINVCKCLHNNHCNILKDVYVIHQAFFTFSCFTSFLKNIYRHLVTPHKYIIANANVWQGNIIISINCWTRNIYHLRLTWLAFNRKIITLTFTTYNKRE